MGAGNGQRHKRNPMTATQYLNDLNHRYLHLHRVKEDFFWDTYMGISDDHDGFDSGANRVDAISQRR